jgi:hypothetical protein
MFVHVALFRWVDEASDADRAGVSVALGALPDLIDSLRTYRFGADLGMADGNWDYAVVAEFDDVDGYVAYRDHPTHQAVLRDHILPILRERAAVQYEPS